MHRLRGKLKRATGIGTGVGTSYYPDLTTDDIRACIQYAREVIAAEDLHVNGS